MHNGDGHSDIIMPVATVKHSGDGHSDITMPVLLQSIVVMNVDDNIRPVANDE
jgi:hypothetical protein